MTTVANILSLIGMGFNTGGRLFKKQENNMLFNLFSNVFFALGYLFLGAYMGLGVMVASILRTLILFSMFKNKQTPQLSTFYLLILVFLTCSLISFTNWLDFCLIMAKSISYTYGAWQHNVKIFRLFSIISCCFTICYNIPYHGYMNIIAESISIIFILIVAIVENNKSKTKKQTNPPQFQ